MHIAEIYTLYKKHPVICTDTRKLTKGCIYFALKGGNFNGNLFAKQAIEQGAAYAIIDEDIAKGDNFILVKDALQTLQNLAKYHREQLTIPIIGLTGSNGKTTTKELMLAALSTQYKTLATEGNLNNHIGVPLTLLKITNEHEMAIIEMGANHVGEIEFLCTIAQPHIGLITNIGRAHLEGFGGYEGVIKAKTELYTFLQKSGGDIVINMDHEVLEAKIPKRPVSTYGSTNFSEVKGVLKQVHPTLNFMFVFANKEYSIKTHLTGAYNLENALAAITIALHFDVTPVNIIKGIEAYKPTNNRSQFVKTKSNTLIMDAYNANPSSMLVALENLRLQPHPNKLAILGDMFELGDESAREHQKVLEQVKQLKIDCILVGKQFKALHTTAFENTEAALVYLKDKKLTNKFILLKGSRGIGLEKLLPVL